MLAKTELVEIKDTMAVLNNRELCTKENIKRIKTKPQGDLGIRGRSEVCGGSGVVSNLLHALFGRGISVSYVH